MAVRHKYSYGKCAKCNATAKDEPNLRFHRFPLPGKQGLLKARIWAEYCYPDEDWSTESSLKSLYQQHVMLCSQHFDDSSYTNTRLTKFAIPIGTQDLLLKLREELCATTSGTIHTNNPVEKIQNTTETDKALTPDEPCFAAPSTELNQPSATNTTETDKALTPDEPCFAAPSTELNQPSATNTTETDKALTPDEPCFAAPSTELNQPSATVRKNTKGILRELDISKSAQLTPNEHKLYKRCRRHLSEIIRLRKKIKTQPRNLLQTLVSDENVTKFTKNNIKGPFALLLQSQLINTPRKLTGRRWSVDDKVMALCIFKRSTACYRLLRRLFCLPSEGTLKSLLNKIPMKCGINPQIIETVKKVAENRNPEENLCILAFDEMSIRKNLTYNVRRDMIDGYQDHDNQGRTMEPATHALLFMAIGIRKRWKQPLAFYFSGDCVTADRLSVLIKEVLDASIQAGLNICATVCDNFGVNIKALNSLGSTVAQPFFDFKGHEIVTIMDPPHLLKCFRNNFMKYHIECTHQEVQNDGKPIRGVAKWSHIKEFYEKDNANPNFVFAPALTKQHLDPNFKQKMKVSLACQVLSHSVASGMLAKIANNELPREATATAMLVEKLDNLFDALNGDSPDLKRGKKYLTNMTRKSAHLPFFQEMRKSFGELKFVGARAKPPSQDGFIRTMNAVERLYNNFEKNYNIKAQATQRRSCGKAGRWRFCGKRKRSGACHTGFARCGGGAVAARRRPV